MIKDLKYKSINSVNPFYLFFNNEINENKYLMLVPTNENKEITKKYEELWSKIIKTHMIMIQRYVKTKFNSEGQLPLNKIIEFPSMIIVDKAVFYENDKYYPQVLLDECLYKL